MVTSFEEVAADHNVQVALRKPFKPPAKAGATRSSYRLAKWASHTMNREEGWPHRIAVLSGHSAREVDYLMVNRTYPELARMWMHYMAEQDSAWDQLM